MPLQRSDGAKTRRQNQQQDDRERVGRPDRGRAGAEQVALPEPQPDDGITQYGSQGSLMGYAQALMVILSIIGFFAGFFGMGASVINADIVRFVMAFLMTVVSLVSLWMLSGT